MSPHSGHPPAATRFASLHLRGENRSTRRLKEVWPAKGLMRPHREATTGTMLADAETLSCECVVIAQAVVMSYNVSVASQEVHGCCIYQGGQQSRGMCEFWQGALSPLSRLLLDAAA